MKPRKITLLAIAVVVVAVGLSAGVRWFGSRGAPPPAPAPAAAEHPVREQPPPGLPIVPWGRRDHFPVIRHPNYVPAKEGDRLLAADEPVLGLVLGGQARAYSTNQLNDHEMVIDDVGGVPVLITY